MEKLFFSISATTLEESWLSQQFPSTYVDLGPGLTILPLSGFQIVFDVVSPSGLRSAYRSICEWVSFIYFLYNVRFWQSIYVSKPT